MLVEQIETAFVSRHIVAMKGNGGGTTKAKMAGASNVIPRSTMNVSLGAAVGYIVVFKTPSGWRFCHAPLNARHSGRGQPEGTELGI
jgi:hypothetical protein